MTALPDLQQEFDMRVRAGAGSDVSARAGTLAVFELGWMVVARIVPLVSITRTRWRSEVAPSDPDHRHKDDKAKDADHPVGPSLLACPSVPIRHDVTLTNKGLMAVDDEHTEPTSGLELQSSEPAVDEREAVRQRSLQPARR